LRLTVIRGAVVAAEIIGALVVTGSGYAQQTPFHSEPVARACIDKRISELLEAQTRDVIGDAALQACTNDLKAEFKEKHKSDCEASDYARWLVANENNKRYGITGSAYKPDKAFIARCEKPAR
jgi:hypothetical protein